MAAELSFTDRLTNLFTSNRNNTKQTFTNTLNESLQFLENWTTPYSEILEPNTITSNYNNLSEIISESDFQNSTDIPSTSDNATLTLLINNPSVSFRIFYSFTLILLSIVGIIGNLLLVIIILQNPLLKFSKQITNIPIFNLAITDLLMLTIVAFPGSIGTILGRNPMDSVSCKLQASFFWTTLLTSICLIGIISTERCMDIVWTSKYSYFVTQETLKISCVISWVPGIIAGIYLFVDNGWVKYYQNRGICDVDFKNGILNPVTWSTLTFVLLFIVPATLLLLLIFPTIWTLGMIRFKNSTKIQKLPPAPPRPRFVASDEAYFMKQKSFSPDLSTTQHSSGFLIQLKSVIQPRVAGVTSKETQIQTIQSLRNELFTKVEARASRHVFGGMEPVLEMDELESERKPKESTTDIQTKSKELTLSLLVVILVFVILVFPITLAQTIKFSPWTCSLAMLFCIAASAINPVIYFFLRQDFRKAIHDTVPNISCYPFDDA